MRAITMYVLLYIAADLTTTNMGMVGGQHVEKQCFKSSEPMPVILMSSGRSGSSAIWQLMCEAAQIARRGSTEDLAGHERRACGGREQFSATKQFGNASNIAAQKAFSARLSPSDNGKWAVKELRRLQMEHSGAPLVGFKWKPYLLEPSFFASALAKIARCHSPTIKVVRNRRNALDVVLSNEKHAANQQLAPHCDASDQPCLQLAARASTGIMIHADTLLEKMREKTRHNDYVDTLLREVGISHVNLDYDRLFYSDRSDEEWKKLLHFLGMDPSLVTLDEVQKSVGMAPTNPHNHTISIGNYGAVRDVLMGTEFESLL